MEKKFYESCMDTDLSLIYGEKLFKRILSKTAGKSWQHVLEYYASRVGEIYLFDIKLNDANLLEVSRPRNSETNKRKFQNMSVDEMDLKMKKLSHLSNTTVNMDSNQIHTLKNFIKSVNELTFASQTKFPAITVLELQNFYINNCPAPNAKIDWLQLLQKLAYGSGMNFTYTNQIKVDMEYVIQLCLLISYTSENTIVNYLHYNFIMNIQTIGLIDPIFHTSVERTNYCIDSIPIKEEINNQLVQFYIPHKSKQMLIAIYETLKVELISEIENSWFEDDLKERAMQKVKGIEVKFSNMFNPLIKETRKYISYNFEIGPSALQNLINFKKAQTVHDILIYNYGSKSNRGKRMIHLRAFYDYSQNYMDLMLGLVFSPFFDPEAPISFNYGRLAALVGHEISHAFDFWGIKSTFKDMPSFDRIGSIYTEKLMCVINQYNRFNINGRLTFHENFADTQGLKLAFKAMNRIIDGNKEEEEKFPDLNIWDARRLFFTSFATMVYNSGKQCIH